MRKTPKLRFKEFSGEWESKKLGDISNIYDGTHQTPKYTDRGIKFVSVENINDIYKGNKYISEEEYNNNFKIKPQINDIFMTRITAGEIGATAIVNKEEDLAYYVSVALIRPYSKKVNSYFLTKYISSKYFKRELNKRIIHVAFPKKINLGDIGECGVYLSRLEEQEKIASFFSLIDEKIQRQQKKVEALEEYKKGIMQKIFSQEIRFKDENGKKYPEWEEKTLGEVIYEPKKEKEKKPFEQQLLTVKLHCKGIEATGNYPNKTENGRPYFKRFKNELLIGRQNFHNGGIGIVGDECDGLIASNAITSYINKEGNNINFIYYQLSRTDFYKRIDLLIGGTGQKEISKSELEKLNIVVPIKAEQDKIIQMISLMEKKVFYEKCKLEELNQLKKGLLQQMFV